MNTARALIALPIQQQIAHTTATFYTIEQTTVHYTSGDTKSKLHNSLTYNSIRQSYRGYSRVSDLNNCSVIPVPRVDLGT